MEIANNLPLQQLSYLKKNKTWRKKHLDWADSKTFFNYSPVRKSVLNKRINYDLVNGKLHVEDMKLILNPYDERSKTIPNDIQHYAIMNSKLDLLAGEEIKRVFDWHVIVTNPTAISEIEEQKVDYVRNELQLAIETSPDKELLLERLDKLGLNIRNWQSEREKRANFLLNQYIKEYNLPLMFNQGFRDAEIVGEEIYQCDIVSGEPVVRRLNPCTVRVFRSGWEPEIEKADIVIIEEYWSPGKIYDTFYDVLTDKDRKYIEELGQRGFGAQQVDEMGHVDERMGFIRADWVADDNWSPEPGFFWNPTGNYGFEESLLPYDSLGNIKVLQMYWKSRRKIKKIKYRDEETGEVSYKMMPETYQARKDLGEEETILWVNEAWEGTKIGDEIYINMRPRPIQYNRLSNPSRCHFGIIGSVYNINNSQPFCLVDRLKPYSYLYDIIHDRLNKLIARNWGTLLTLDLAKVPKGWEIDKWLYYARVNGIAVVDSFKEGNLGASTGVLSGALNNATSGAILAGQGDLIQQYINLLEYIKTTEMSDVSGISRQREGSISNRETVGGVERATLQSSHITEWLFLMHDDVKRRVLECLLETAKIALRGHNVKFLYLLPSGSTAILEIDGDEFAEADYGLLVDNSDGLLQLKQQIEGIAQLGVLAGTIPLSAIMKIYLSCSMAEKIQMIELSEELMQQQQQQQQLMRQQQQQLQLQQQQQIEEQKRQLEQLKLDLEREMNTENNETKILIALILAQSKADEGEAQRQHDDGIQIMQSELQQMDLEEKIRQFDEKIRVDREKLAADREKNALAALAKAAQPNNTAKR